MIMINSTLTEFN